MRLKTVDILYNNTVVQVLHYILVIWDPNIIKSVLNFFFQAQKLEG